MRISKLCTLLVVIALPFLLLSCAGTGPVAQDFGKYIGQTYPPVPPPLKEVGGFMIEPLGQPEYGSFEVVDQGVHLVWLMRLLTRDAEGRPLWQIEDVLPLPRVDQGEVVLYTLCGQSGQYNPEIVAIAKDEENKEFLTTVRRAWQGNRSTGKFHEIATAGIACDKEKL